MSTGAVVIPARRSCARPVGAYGSVLQRGSVSSCGISSGPCRAARRWPRLQRGAAQDAGRAALAAGGSAGVSAGRVALGSGSQARPSALCGERSQLSALRPGQCLGEEFFLTVMQNYTSASAVSHS